MYSNYIPLEYIMWEELLNSKTYLKAKTLRP